MLAEDFASKSKSSSVLICVAEAWGKEGNGTEKEVGSGLGFFASAEDFSASERPR